MASEAISNAKKRRYPSDVASTSNQQKSPKKTKSAMMISLECPVCLEVPRIGAGPILGNVIQGCRG